MPKSKPRPETPNILFIHAESMDGRAMGCMGHPAMQGATPNLDALAERGTLFRQAYSICPVCVPSRAGMWSGKYPNHNDCWNNHEGLREGVPIFRDAFDAAGYRTAAIGPLDYAWGKHSIRDRVGSWTRTASILRPINKVPLPVVIEEAAHPGDWTRADQAIDELREAARDSRPFMLYLTTSLVHPAFVTTQRYLDRIDADRVRVPPGLRDVSDDDHPVDRYMRITKNHSRALPPELVRQIRRVYFAMIAELDDIVGKVLESVEALGLADSTYAVFSSDHGEMAGEHSQILKRSMHEPSIHAPMIISGPDVRRGGAVDTPVSLIDIYPTLLDMAGARYEDFAKDKAWPDALDGESLMPQLTGSSERTRDWAFAEYHGDRCPTSTYMLRRDRWKLLSHVGYQPQLFDVEADPWELEDVAASNPAVVSEMQGVLDENFDCEGIHQRSVRYDRRSFRQWREEQKRDGTYEETMARVYSGFSRLCMDDYAPWTERDERRIEEWLDRGEAAE